MAGSESSSQSINVIGPTLTCWQGGKGLRHGADRLAISPDAAGYLSSSHTGNEYRDKPMVTKGHSRLCGGLSLKLPGYRAAVCSVSKTYRYGHAIIVITRVGIYRWPSPP